MKYTCIYCKETKEEEEFNREHVVPRMMGRYTNGLVLSEHQVCKKCNSYFSTDVEDKIALDSYEAFLRMKNGTKKMSGGKRIGNTRIKLSGADGIFKGLSFVAVSDETVDRLHFEIAPCIGFKISENEYEYVSIDEIEHATDDKLESLRKFNNPIIQFGYEQDVIESVLMEKGYINDKAVYSQEGIREAYGSKDFTTSIKLSVDSYARRVCAKTIFNYLCYKFSTEEMLNPKYDKLRNYIRYGEWSEELWFRLSKGFVSSITPPNDTAHVVGAMIGRGDDKIDLLVCVTWFGEITYIFRICEIEPIEQTQLPNGQYVSILPQIETPFTYFDNESTKIIDENATIIFGGNI